MNKARIVYYISPGGLKARGGMGGIARYLTEEFAKQNPELQCKVLDPYGSRLTWRTPFFFASVAARLFLAGITGGVDAVHLHMSHGGSVTRKLWLLRIARLTGLPALIHLHGSKFQTYCDGLSVKRRRKIGRRLAEADRVIVIGNFWKDYLIAALAVPAEKICIVYNGVPLTKAIPVRANRNPVRILCAGLLGKRKGSGDLLQALAQEELADLSWHATMAGNGEVAAYQSQAATLGLGEQVNFPGWVDPSQIPALLRDSDIFVLPSHNEGLPVAILEAMMASLPVITTPVGAILELVVPEVTAKIVPVGSVSELAIALTALIRSSDLRVKLGEAGRSRVAQQFTITVIAQQILALYDQLAAQSAH